MAPPGPREGSPSFFTTFKGYTFDASLTVLENFQRLAIKRGWAVTSPTWRRNWSACFGRPFTADQNPFLYAAPDFDFFKSFPDYRVIPTITVAKNFKRLANLRHWGLGSKHWRRQWRACFGRIYTNDQNPFDSDRDSDSDSDSDSDDEDDDSYVISDAASLLTHSNASSESFESGSSNSVSTAAHPRPIIKNARARPTFKDQRSQFFYDEFERFFGDSEDRLDAWQKLCCVVGVEVGPSITKCKKALKPRSVMINLVNLVHHMRSLPPDVVANPDALPYPEAGVPLRKFGSKNSFRNYIREDDECLPKHITTNPEKKTNCLPREVAKANGFVNSLLRQVFLPFHLF